MIASPVPAEVPPHDPVNHCVVAPGPFDPPATVRVVFSPLQMVVVPVAPVGAVDKPFTVIVGLVVTVKFSAEGTNTAFALPFPAAVPVKVTVAIPED